MAPKSLLRSATSFREAWTEADPHMNHGHRVRPGFFQHSGHARKKIRLALAVDRDDGRLQVHENSSAGQIRNELSHVPARRIRSRETRKQKLQPTRLVHRSAAAGCLTGAILAEHEGEQNQAQRHPGQLHVDVLVALRLRLQIELVVNTGQGHAVAIGAAGAVAEHACEGLGMLLEADAG